jgi:hypothetical protein
VYEYRKYVCSSFNVQPGICKPYAVHESVILDELVKQLLEVHTNPKRLERLRAQLHKKASAKHEKAPAQVERLRTRLAEKDAEIRDAARNVLRAKDNADLLNELLTDLRKERNRLARELEAAEQAKQEPAEDVGKEVEAAIDRLYDLREQLIRADKPELGAIIARMVSRVNLFFEPVQKGKRMWYHCTTILIKTRRILDVKGSDPSGK